MEREFSIDRLEESLAKYEVIEEPIFVKIPNKEDMVLLTLEEYIRLYTIDKLMKSEEDIKMGRVHDAEEVFKELRDKYGY